jgi:hypothetical protein
MTMSGQGHIQLKVDVIPPDILSCCDIKWYSCSETGRLKKFIGNNGIVLAKNKVPRYYTFRIVPTIKGE